MDLITVLDRVAATGARLWVEGGRLHCRAPVGGLSAELQALLKRHRDELVALLSGQASSASTPAGPSFKVVARTEKLPLSVAQQSLFLLGQLDPSSIPSYNERGALRLRGPLDADRWEQALKALILRHESLRTSVEVVEGVPYMRIDATPDWQLERRDLRGLDATTQALAVQQLGRLLGETPIPTDQAPLLRAVLVQLSAEEHIFMLAAHHMVCDAASVAVAMREVARFYQGLASPEPPTLPALPLQFVDYAVSHRTWLEGAEAEAQRHYWLEQLRGIPVLELPFDRPRGPSQDHRGATVSLTLSDSLTQGLRELARSSGVTLFTVLISSYAVLLQRYSRQDDFGIGTSVSGRSQESLRELVGYVVNVLVLRPKLAGQRSFNALLKGMQGLVMEALQRPDIPFEQLVQGLRPERSLSVHPLFQAMFFLVQATRDPLQLPGLPSERLRLPQVMSKFDLSLEVEEVDGTLHGAFVYRTALFDEGTIAELAQAWLKLLEGVVQAPNHPMELISLCPSTRITPPGAAASDRQPLPYPTLHAWFSAQAQRTPSHIALSHEQGELSYATLEAQAEQWSQRLRALISGPEPRIGLCVERSAELVIGILAILKAGGAYVPLDPSYPAERLRFIFEDSGIQALVTTQALLEQLPSAQRPAACLLLDAPLEPRAPAPASEAEALLSPLPSPETAAYVIYTSGSTGRPKGVVVTHHNVLRLMTVTTQRFHFGAQDVWTLFHSFAFDFSVWELWGALLFGGRLVIVPWLTSRSPEAFYQLLQDQKVTVLNQTPSAFRQLMAVDALEQAKLALRLVIFGGEALEPAMLRSWMERHGETSPQLVNMYGITETTVHVTWHTLTRADATRGHVSVIGEPLPDLQLHVLDGQLQPVPVGAPGELFVGGEGLARGYLHRAPLTAERFLPDPFSSRPGARLYRTGDLARRRADGQLEYRGRLDQQVKVRGFRIELGEIEAALHTVPGIAEAVVQLRSQAEGSRLVAYVVPQPGSALSRERLRELLAARLPDYMVPAGFVVLDAMPLTSHGKLDSKALAALPETRLQSEQALVTPETVSEQLLAEVWAQVLELPSVGVLDNYFALGGDSIRSLRIVSEARKRGLELSVRQLFEHTTIRMLCRQLEHTSVTEEDSGPSPFALLPESEREALQARPAGHADVLEDAYPLSRLQAGMIFHSTLAPERAVYHDLFTLTLQAQLDVEALRDTLAEQLALHPTLRTSFELNRTGEPLQQVHAHVAVPLELYDLRMLSPEAQRQQLDLWQTQEKQRGFRWEQAPLWRAIVHRLTENSFQFQLSFHHALLDGWSVAVWTTSLFQGYLARLEARRTPPPPQEAERSLARFIALERAALQDGNHRAFWEAQLAGCQV